MDSTRLHFHEAESRTFFCSLRGRDAERTDAVPFKGCYALLQEVSSFILPFPSFLVIPRHFASVLVFYDCQPRLLDTADRFPSIVLQYSSSCVLSRSQSFALVHAFVYLSLIVTRLLALVLFLGFSFVCLNHSRSVTISSSQSHGHHTCTHTHMHTHTHTHMHTHTYIHTHTYTHTLFLVWHLRFYYIYNKITFDRYSA